MYFRRNIGFIVVCFSYSVLVAFGCGGNQVNPAYTYLCASNLDCPSGTSCDLVNGVCTANVLPDTVNTVDTTGVIDTTGSPNLGPAKDPNALLPNQSGVVYTGHFMDQTLRMTRIDGLFPETGPSIEMSGLTHDMVLDPIGNALYVAHDVIDHVAVYSLTRPNSPAEPLTTPLLLTSLGFNETPRFLTMDAFNRRLYVSTAPDTGGDLLTQMHIYVYDITDPSLPLLLTPEPFVVPVHVTMSVDSARNLLFLSDFLAHQLMVYDTAWGGLTPLPGNPINLRQLYPQENNSGFQVRSLLAVASENRFYAARSQGANSELIAFTYNPGLPSGTSSYSLMANTADFIPMADSFDVDLPPEQRTNLLDAFTVLHDPTLNSLFMVANAWDGTMSSAIVFPMRNDLSVAPGCGQFEGFGCFYEGVFGSKQTDGAACIDWTHRKIVGTSISDNSDEEPGSIHVFSYDQNLGMAAQYEQNGSNPLSGIYPVATVCH